MVMLSMVTTAAITSGDGLIGMVNPNLDANLPVCFGIHGSGNTGHEVVCDGYGYNSGTMYHHI